MGYPSSHWDKVLQTYVAHHVGVDHPHPLEVVVVMWAVVIVGEQGVHVELVRREVPIFVAEFVDRLDTVDGLAMFTWKAAEFAPADWARFGAFVTAEEEALVPVVERVRRKATNRVVYISDVHSEVNGTCFVTVFVQQVFIDEEPLERVFDEVLFQTAQRLGQTVPNGRGKGLHRLFLAALFRRHDT